jgi:hypothetical protein
MPAARLTWGRLREIGDVADNGPRVEQTRLIDEQIHPRAADLVVALEESP